MAKKIKPPKDLYRVVIEPGGGYGQYPKYEKFWHIEKFDQEWSNMAGKIVYRRISRGGLNFTRWGMWRAIKKELKRLNAGYQVEHYSINGVKID